jgi:hypothetical protein
MLRHLTIGLAALVCLSVAAIPIDATARGGGGGHGGGGGGHGGFGGGHAGFSGGHPGFSGGPGVLGGRPGLTSRAMPGTPALANRGVAGQPLVGRGMPGKPFAGRKVTGNGRYAWIGHHRVHGRHMHHRFFVGLGFLDYWYYGDCYVLTDYGWINLCDYGDPAP